MLHQAFLHGVWILNSVCQACVANSFTCRVILTALNSLSLMTNFGLKITLLQSGTALPTYFLGPFAWKMSFPSSHPKAIFVFASEGHFMQATKSCILVCNPIC